MSPSGRRNGICNALFCKVCASTQQYYTTGTEDSLFEYESPTTSVHDNLRIFILNSNSSECIFFCTTVAAAANVSND